VLTHFSAVVIVRLNKEAVGEGKKKGGKKAGFCGLWSREPPRGEKKKSAANSVFRCQHVPEQRRKEGRASLCLPSFFNEMQGKKRMVVGNCG